MIAKLTPENQVELPRQLLEALGSPSHFDIAMEGNRLVLTPARAITADDVYRHLESLNLQESDVEEAVAWARRQSNDRDAPV